MTFQIFLAPALFAVLDSFIENRLLLVAVVAVASMGFFALTSWLRHRRQKRITESYGKDSDASEVLFCIGLKKSKAVDLAERLISEWSPAQLTLFVTDKSSGLACEADLARNPCGGADSPLRGVFEAVDSMPQKVSIQVKYLDADDERDAKLIAHSVLQRLNKADDNALVDITGGTAIMTIGLYQAALARGVRAGYLKDVDGSGQEFEPTVVLRRRSEMEEW